MSSLASTAKQQKQPCSSSALATLPVTTLARRAMVRFDLPDPDDYISL